MDALKYLTMAMSVSAEKGDVLDPKAYLKMGMLYVRVMVVCQRICSFGGVPVTGYSVEMGQQSNAAFGQDDPGGWLRCKRPGQRCYAETMTILQILNPCDCNCFNIRNSFASTSCGSFLVMFGNSGATFDPRGCGSYTDFFV